jgi:CheY-like chemotaxis protein
MDKQTILIVDDEKKIVELLKETIKKMSKDYKILEAYNGKEALEKIDKEKIVAANYYIDCLQCIGHRGEFP